MLPWDHRLTTRESGTAMRRLQRDDGRGCCRDEDIDLNKRAGNYGISSASILLAFALRLCRSSRTAFMDATTGGVGHFARIAERRWLIDNV